MGNTASRPPPSPSTYAAFLETQRSDHTPPDSESLFDHSRHIHFAEVYDCPPPPLEDRFGYCFTLMQDAMDYRIPLSRIGGWELQKGDAISILSFMSLCIISWVLLAALKWVFGARRWRRRRSTLGWWKEQYSDARDEQWREEASWQEVDLEKSALVEAAGGVWRASVRTDGDLVETR